MGTRTPDRVSVGSSDLTSTDATIHTEMTFCRVCHASCPMEVDVADNKVLAVRGVMDDPLFEGYTCIKGRQLPDQMADPNRLRAPLRRRSDGTFEQVTSGQALDEIAVELRRIIDTYGPRAVASYTGTGGYQNFFRISFGRNLTDLRRGLRRRVAAAGLMAPPLDAGEEPPRRSAE